MKQTYKSYMKDYWKSKCKRISLLLHKEKDADIIKAIDENNIQGSIKELVREGMKAKGL